MMEMTRLKFLKRKKGFSYVMTAVCLIAVLLIGTGIFEVIRINIAAANVRDKFEDAIIATSVSNYAQMYQDVRESHAATYSYNGSRWIECNRTTRSQISDYMRNAMSRGEIAQCTIRSIDFTVTPAELAPYDTDTAEKFSVEGTMKVEIPYNFAWGSLPPMEFTLNIKSTWRAKF